MILIGNRSFWAGQDLYWPYYTGFSVWGGQSRSQTAVSCTAYLLETATSVTPHGGEVFLKREIKNALAWKRPHITRKPPRTLILLFDLAGGAKFPSVAVVGEAGPAFIVAVQ